MMAVVVADVVARAINPSWRITGTLDLVEFSLDWTICLAIACALFAGPALSVDLIDKLDTRGRLALLGTALLLVIMIVMGLQTVRPALNVLEWGEQTFDLGLPKFWYWLAIWAGLGLSVIAISLQILAKVLPR